MLITLYRRTAICQSVAEVKLTGLVPLGAVRDRFNLSFNNNNNNNNNNYYYYYYYYYLFC